jgi:hypothetical protein
MSLKDQAVSILERTSFLWVYDLFGGLSEFWFGVFAVITIYFEWKGKLEPNFAITITAITAILMAHEALDDMHSRKMRQGGGPPNGQGTQVVGSQPNQT